MATFIVETSKECLRVDADCAEEAKSYVRQLIFFGEIKGKIIDAWETELF